MSTMINLRERGQISKELDEKLTIGEKYKKTFAQALAALGVDEYYASREQIELAHSEAEKACKPLQDEFALQAAQEEQVRSNNRVNNIVSVLSGDLRGVTISLFNEFDQVKNIGYFSNGVWSICDVSELTESNKESLLNTKTNQVKAWAAEFLTKAVAVHEGSSFVEVDDNTTLNADELKAARKAAKQAEKAAKIMAKKGRI